MLGNFRSGFSQLADELIRQNKPDSARIALEKCLEVIPDTVVPYNVYNVLIVEGLYKIGDSEKATDLAQKIRDNVYDELDYYMSLGQRYYNYLLYEKQLAFYTLNELRGLAISYERPELAGEIGKRMMEYASALNISL